jgi:hypothetical protein
MSITSIIHLLTRVARRNKPGRIFYVSDFDPAGDGMPTAVARQIEFWLDRHAMRLDIKLNPVALTRGQVIAHRLPRIPVKETDRRKAHFEERYGDGAVELDALEALHPGVLAHIVQQQIQHFRAEDLADKLAEAKRGAEEELQALWEERIEPYRNHLDTLQEQVREVTERYQARLEQLGQEMDGELAPYQTALTALRQAIRREVDTLDVVLSELPEPTGEPEKTSWLFDSNRDYFEQLAVYQARKHKPKESDPPAADGPEDEAA